MRRCMGLIPGWVLMLVTACGDARPLVVIAVSGIPAGVAKLRAIATLDGRQAAPFLVDASEGRFSLGLERGVRGQLRVQVSALGGDLCATARGQTEITVTDDVRIEAALALSPLQQDACLILVERDGSGKGSVFSEPPGISCLPTCAVEFESGAAIALRAEPDPDSFFGGWSGACAGGGACSLLARGETRVTATFSARPRSPLLVQKSGPGRGTVTSDPAGIACGEQCTFAFAQGRRVKLLATPERHSYFAGWSGACTGTGPCELTISADMSVTAHFAERVCTPDSLCWEHPFPQGNSLNGVWGASGTDVWAVGDGGTVLRYDGFGWSGVRTESEVALTGVYGFGQKDVWIVGDQGTALHFTGGALQKVPSGTNLTLQAVWGSGPAAVWAVGGNYSGKSVIVRYGGSRFTEVPAGGATSMLFDVWGSGPNEVWAVGQKGAMLRWNGEAWSQVMSGYTTDLLAIWGVSRDDIWVVGRGGLILRYDGTRWNKVDGGTMADLHTVRGLGPARVWAAGQGVLLEWNGTRWEKRSSRYTGLVNEVWGQKPDDLWAVGGLGTLLHWNGTAWNLLTSGSTRVAYAGWGSGPGDIWVVGDGYSGYEPVLHFDGSRWSEVAAKNSLRSIWGSGKDDLWVVGQGGTIQRYQGGGFVDIASGTTQDLTGVWGAGADDIWVVGEGGTVLHYAQGKWGAVPSGTTVRLNSIWGSGPSDIWAAGHMGTLLHYNGTRWARVPSGTTNSLRAVWGSGPDDVWIGGGAYGEEPVLLRVRGGAPEAVRIGSARVMDPINGIWGSGPTDVWLVIDGHENNVLRYDGTGFRPLRYGGSGVPLSGVYGVSPRDVFVFGFQGMILRYRP